MERTGRATGYVILPDRSGFGELNVAVLKDGGDEFLEIFTDTGDTRVGINLATVKDLIRVRKIFNLTKKARKK